MLNEQERRRAAAAPTTRNETMKPLGYVMLYQSSWNLHNLSERVGKVIRKRVTGKEESCNWILLIMLSGECFEF